MRYKITDYDQISDYFYCKDEMGEIIRLDLFTDASFPELQKQYGKTIRENKVEFMRELIGKTVEIEEIFPYTPCYFGKNVKILNE